MNFKTLKSRKHNHYVYYIVLLLFKIIHDYFFGGIFD